MAAEKYRLLICNVDKTVEVLPDYVGPPENDDTLNYALAGHKFPSGEPHRGQLADVEAKHWDSPSTQQHIRAQIAESAGHTGLNEEFYAVKATFGEDAMTCWKQHNRNPVCPDYKSEKKLLQPPTVRDRKSEGLGKFKSTTYLCDFCPVKSIVQQAHFAKTGQYN